jgi:hypothetical protein
MHDAKMPSQAAKRMQRSIGFVVRWENSKISSPLPFVPNFAGFCHLAISN